MMPGTVFVFQPAFGNYRVYFTGGCTNANKWIFGSYNDQRSFDTLEDIGAPVRKIYRGVYALV